MKAECVTHKSREATHGVSLQSQSLFSRLFQILYIMIQFLAETQAKMWTVLQSNN